MKKQLNLIYALFEDTYLIGLYTIQELKELDILMYKYVFNKTFGNVDEKFCGLTFGEYNKLTIDFEYKSIVELKTELTKTQILKVIDHDFVFDTMGLIEVLCETRGVFK